MRYVVVGAGAVGGVIAGRMVAAGHDVVAVARGEHGRVIKADGLRIESPGGVEVVRVPVAASIGEVDWSAGDLALLTVKSQHTVGALDELRAATDLPVPIVCAQNGVGNESEALRRFPDVYGICVMCPCGYLEPGVVEARWHPVSGLLDIGRYPGGVDERAAEIAAALSGSTFESRPVPDVMRWKYRKLILNLGNAVQVLCGPQSRRGELSKRLAAEGEACLAAAGIDVVSVEDDRARRDASITLPPVGTTGVGGSTWQSIVRGAGSIETDYLTGEIVLLGRLHGVATPANELVQSLVNDVFANRRTPGEFDESDLLARLGPGSPNP